MPAWVINEAHWKKAKEAAGKSTRKDSKSYYKLANYIYHRMGKTEESKKQSEIAKNELIKTLVDEAKTKAPKEDLTKMAPMNIKLTKLPSAGKTGSLAVKTPKSKKFPQAGDKASLFMKKEDFNEIKHPKLMALRDFINKVNKIK